MTVGLVDLHVHTTASDGVLTPKEIIDKAHNLGLSAIGICDHDTVAGVKEALEAGEELQIEVVPGIELSVCYKNKELHFLGYFVDFENALLVSKTKFLTQEREKRAKRIIKKLKNLGFFLDYSEISQRSKGTIAKSTITDFLLRKEENKEKLKKVFGKIPTVSEFIVHYLLVGKEAYIPKKKLTVKEAISLIHKVGGVAILAHPGYDFTFAEDKEIVSFKKFGLEGLEAIHYIESIQRSKETIRHYTNLAKRENWLITGGSDYHGIKGGKNGNPGVNLGFKDLPFRVERKIYDTLKKYWEQKQGRKNYGKKISFRKN